ncbi:hypothetical protein KSD_29640 [Ktedonobacter sp. SOSP1-85]|nr:ATP-binding cassette domain-containing protein [Ktedonobacter sp. SOSP1-85]GHO75193.1 hypothetical protein KSD_29640 [Ktedonobacter sp. SOSP1-85]
MCYTSGMLDVSLSTQLDTFTLDVSFAVPQGTTTVLLGESGAGKSTVLRLLAGLLQPQAGHIILDKQVYYDSKRGLALPPQARPFGYVFQEYMLFPHLTVFENIAFGLRAQAEARSRIRLRVAEALAQVHLEGYAQRYPAQLSGDSSSAWRWHAPWFYSHSYCYWTSRSLPWMYRRGARYARNYAVS